MADDDELTLGPTLLELYIKVEIGAYQPNCRLMTNHRNPRCNVE